MNATPRSLRMGLCWRLQASMKAILMSTSYLPPAECHGDSPITRCRRCCRLDARRQESTVSLLARCVCIWRNSAVHRADRRRNADTRAVGESFRRIFLVRWLAHRVRANPAMATSLEALPGRSNESDLDRKSLRFEHRGQDTARKFKRLQSDEGGRNDLL